MAIITPNITESIVGNIQFSIWNAFQLYTPIIKLKVATTLIIINVKRELLNFFSAITFNPKLNNPANSALKSA